MLITILVNIFAFFVFLFIVWKRLKEDYSTENVFTLCFVTAFGLVLGYLLAKFIAPLYWFWMEALGILFGFVFLAIKKGLKFYETFEALFIAFLTWFGIYWVFLFIKTPAITSFLASFLIVSFIVLFYLLEGNYKDFTWYKSGRIGFAGLVTAGLFFLSRSAIASLFPFMLSFSGKTEIYISAVASFIMFLLVYNLSRNEK
ncbi:MAG: hypothetical protein Q8P91_02615 [bacterium]|nr:hypothetical protein [bacterium]